MKWPVVTRRRLLDELAAVEAYLLDVVETSEGRARDLRSLRSTLRELERDNARYRTEIDPTMRQATSFAIEQELPAPTYRLTFVLHPDVKVDKHRLLVDALAYEVARHIVAGMRQAKRVKNLYGGVST